jgi:hypothetical protein
MSVQLGIEQRLAALEQAVAEIQQRLGEPAAVPDWLARICGSMKDVPEEDWNLFLEYCKEIKQEGRPTDEPVEEP